ncbi:uncharacterized protein EDB91DRAFT_649008 [Suillus paluster]|uniref:uncharacterized protein n=1 Tax=Suillus paluster TaxID=48578 RepID=UPI001B8605DD|nr:uncharacterized protein EDB91DRAFT_649008 [Suillus paluster]KAG1718178.1 hypothetical protein EDB91DRAFT_649008 [Suillus paluster]
MFTRLSTGFCVLLGLTALLGVNAGVVPVARDVEVGSYGTSALYAIIRDTELDKRVVVRETELTSGFDTKRDMELTSGFETKRSYSGYIWGGG